ncbi:nonribosomal peptide synthetase [Fusarium heterosporum]|uniref:Nonribosomal peptide synthetase n=1 Tax=Fusarium heterosporum TaxID=42747 RepID=A0A8H5TLK1_FUSHE|nr:nonribosomal peptide synthetase [Fusarium heterosporum]
MATPRQNSQHPEVSASGGGESFHSQSFEQQQQTSPEHAVGSDFEPQAMITRIDKIASEDPTRPFTWIPATDNPRDGWKAVTFLQLTNAINHLAHAIFNMTKGSADEFPTVAYIGPNDVRYPMMLLACVRAGCKAFFISPRNTTAVQLSLFEATDCHHIYYAGEFQSAVKPCLDQRTMEAIVIDSVDYYLGVISPPFPYNRSADQIRWDPLIVLHTSGSTGTPKPIVVRNGSLNTFQKMLHLPKFHGSNFFMKEWAERSKKMLICMPLFHAAGTFTMLLPIFIRTCTVMMISNKPLGNDTALQGLEHSGCDAAVFPPSIIEGLVASEQGIEILAKLQFVAFGGGNLSPVAGEALVKRGGTLSNVIGSTEHFPYAIYAPTDRNLWQYFIFNSEHMGIDWRRRDQDRYELVIRRKDVSIDQPCFYTFPDLSEWSTKDIYEPHPTLKDLWRYIGRADDVIVFSNGEKLNPVSIEATINGHALVNGAIVVGQQKFQAALILEPTQEAWPKDDDEISAFIDNVWPLVEKANSETVAHGRITKNLVAIADPAKPFLRAGKGTVQRENTVKIYADFIESLYEKAGTTNAGDTSIVLDLADEHSLTRSIILLFETELGVEALEQDTDFFSAGVDSLKVITATNLLRSTLRKAGVDATTIEPRIVYGHPTARELATYILSIDNEADHQDEETKQMQETERLAAKYMEDMPCARDDKQDPSNNDQTILVTGTTGSLGAYMLDRLCKLPTVKKVIALNRDKDGGESRQLSINESRGLTQDFSKVVFLYANLSLPNLGLEQEKYRALLANVDRIIHNAWPVNFNISVSSFESSICGVRHLVDFSAEASKHVPIVFISSIGTVMGWSSSDSIPEKALNDMTLAQMGYGRSKLAASLILDAAAEKSNIHTASVRVGQIAGPRGEKGAWNRQEFIPSLIASSVYLGVLPDHLGAQQEVTWTPVEDIAGLILDITGITTQKPISDISGYFHGVNPAVVDWPSLAIAVKDFYGDRMRIVSLEEWVDRLEASEKEADMSVDKNPAVKLLDTYRGMLEAKTQGQTTKFSMERTKSHSPTITEAGPITPELMRNWCRQWDF